MAKRHYIAEIKIDKFKNILYPGSSGGAGNGTVVTSPNTFSSIFVKAGTMLNNSNSGGSSNTSGTCSYRS